MTLNPFKLYSQISAFFKIRTEVIKLMDEAKTEVVASDGAKKPGWKTSEFWLSLIGIGATIGAAAVPFIPASALAWIAGVSVVVPSVYAVMRTIAKQTTTTKDDKFLDRLVEKLSPVVKLEE